MTASWAQGATAIDLESVQYDSGRAALRWSSISATCEPKVGEILLYAGDLSELELLIPYGTARFCSKAGLLKGNPVLMIDDPLSVLPELGRRVLWDGGVSFRIENR